MTVRVSTASRSAAQEFGNAAEAAAAELAAGGINRPRLAARPASSSRGGGPSDAGDAPAPHPTEALLLDDRVVRLANTPLRCVAFRFARED